MSDIALRTNTDLMAFTEEAGQVHKIAQALATTSFVPASMKGKPDEITGAIPTNAGACKGSGCDQLVAIECSR